MNPANILSAVFGNRSLLPLAVAAAAVCTLGAQTSRPGSVHGSVVSTTGEPLRKAEVTLRAVGGRGPGAPAGAAFGRPGPMPAPSSERPSVLMRTTDAGGSFHFENVPAGSYQIYVQRNGYVHTRSGRTGGNSETSITVADGQTVTGVTLKMSPHGVVAGKVVDEDGDPMMHVSVQVLRERWVRGQRQLMPAGAGSTNDLGEYRIAGIAPGTYRIVASHRRPEPPGARPRPDNAGGDLRYAHQFYPGVTDMAQAAPVRLEPGQEVRGMDFQMRKTPTFRVRGKVVDESGKPATGVGINAIPSDGYFLGPRGMGIARNAQGVFELSGLSPGTYTLVANRQGRDQPRSSARLAVTIGNRDIDDLVLQLQPGFSVTGVVKLPEGVTPTAPARVMFEQIEPGIPLLGGASANVQSNGSWTATNLMPGRYRIFVSPLPAGTYVKAVMAGGQDVTGGAEISGPATGVEVQLGANAPEVTGTVLGADKQPVGEAVVVLAPDPAFRDRQWLFRTATTDENGVFRIQGLTPGSYTAWAFREVEDGAWHSLEFFSRQQGKGTPVKLDEGSAETIQITATDPT